MQVLSLQASSGTPNETNWKQFSKILAKSRPSIEFNCINGHEVDLERKMEEMLFELFLPI